MKWELKIKRAIDESFIHSLNRWEPYAKSDVIKYGDWDRLWVECKKRLQPLKGLRYMDDWYKEAKFWNWLIYKYKDGILTDKRFHTMTACVFYEPKKSSRRNVAVFKNGLQKVLIELKIIKYAYSMKGYGTDKVIN